MQVPVSMIIPNPDQPRTVFDQADLEGLAQSLKEDGQLQPAAVEGPVEGGFYVLLDGERRWRAAKLAGLKKLEVYVKESQHENGAHRLLYALVGNMQRSDMGPVDEARAYEELTAGGMSIAEIARHVGRSKTHVYQHLGFLDGKLEGETLTWLNAGKLPIDYGALRALKKLDRERQVLVARRAMLRGSSASAIKRAVARVLRSAPMAYRRQKKRDADPRATVAPALKVHGTVLGEDYASVVEATIVECDQCGLSDAKGLVCQDCPLALMLARLVEDSE